MKKLLQVLIKTNNPTHTRTGLIIFTYIQNVLGEQTGEIIHDHLTVTQIIWQWHRFCLCCFHWIILMLTSTSG